MQEADVVGLAPLGEVDVAWGEIGRHVDVAAVSDEDYADPLPPGLGISLGAPEQLGEAALQLQPVLLGQLLPNPQAVAAGGGLGLQTSCTQGGSEPIQRCVSVSSCAQTQRQPLQGVS